MSAQLEQFLRHFPNARRVGKEYKASCPVPGHGKGHGDKNPSLSIWEKDGRICLKCWAGCEELRVVSCANLVSANFETELPAARAPGFKATTNPLDYTDQNGELLRFVCNYDYTDAAGNLLYWNRRYLTPDGDKTFRIWRPGQSMEGQLGRGEVPPTLYNLPALVNSTGTVLFVEGEKDCLAAANLGFVGTTSGGAQSWKPEFAEYFVGRTVVIIPDADAPGRGFANKVAEDLCDKASSLRVMELDTKDLSEWVERGGTPEELSAQIAIHRELKFGQKKLLPFRTARQIAQETPEKVEWVVKPYVAKGAITEVDGKVKLAGKSTWTTHLCSAVLDGLPFMGEPTTKTSIVYLTEQPPASWRIMLEKAGLLWREDFHTLYFRDVRGITWSDVADEAVEYCRNVGAGLLIVDTLGQFAGIAGDSENNAGDALAAMLPLQEAAGNGLAVMVLRHDRKSGGNVGESGRGSSAYSGAVDIVMSIRRPEGNTRKSLREIHALGRFDETPDKLMIDLTPEGYVALGATTKVAETEGENALLEVMPHTEAEGVNIEELIKGTGVKRQTAQRALDSLCLRGIVSKCGAGKKGSPLRYFLPKAVSAQTSNMGYGQNGQKVDRQEVMQ